MKKFVLKIDPFCIEDVTISESSDKQRSLERHFTTAEVIVQNHCEENRLLDVLELYGGKFLNLKIIIESRIKSRKLLKILLRVPQLEKLTLQLHKYCGKLYPKKIAPEDRVTLKKLKKLEVGDWNLLKMIEAPLLMELETSFADKNYDSERFGSFLKSSPKLVSLKVMKAEYKGMSFLNEISPGFPFQLKNFSCDGAAKITENIREFLLSQAATIEALEARGLDLEFHEIVLTNFKRLRSLKSNMLGASGEFFLSFEPLPLLKEFTSTDYFSSEDAMRAVLGKYPELTKLSCVNDGKIPDYLDFIADTNEKLEVLDIFTIREMNVSDQWINDIYSDIRLTNARFPCLTELSIQQIENGETFMAFLYGHPTIKTLRIRELNGAFKDCNVPLFIEQTNLKHVCLGASDDSDSFSEIEEIYDWFKRCGTGNCETLELHMTWETEEGKSPLCGTTTKISEFHFNFLEGDELKEHLKYYAPTHVYNKY